MLNQSLLRFLTGARVLDTHIYKPGSYPFDLIAPVTILWKPTPSTETPAPKAPSQTTHQKKKLTGKGKEKEWPLESIPPQDPAIRTVWVWTHPATYSDIFSALQASASLALESIKLSGGPRTEVEIADFREHVNVFEIMGPKSSQVLKGALKPVKEENRDEFKKVSWRNYFLSWCGF